MFFKNTKSLKQETVTPASPYIKSEEEKIKKALQTTYNNRSAAAKLLGISRATLYNKMTKYGIS